MYYNYHPFIETYYGIYGDSVINDTMYHKVYILNDSLLADTSLYQYLGVIRDDTLDRVYFRPDRWDRDLLLYDFSADIGETIRSQGHFTTNGKEHYFGTGLISNTIIDIIEEDGIITYYLETDRSPSGMDVWIYGIGSTYGLFGSILRFPIMPYDWKLACFKQNDTIQLIANYMCEKCFCSTWVGIDDKEKTGKKITIRNPVNEILEFSICELPSGELIQYSVFNLAGVLLMKGSATENPGQIFMHDLENGLYLINFQAGNETLAIKFVKSQ